MRVVFTDMTLGAACCRREAMAGRWGDAARHVELALSTLKASRDLERFLALPIVTQEDAHVIFTTPEAAVRLLLAEKEIGGRRDCVDVLAIGLIQQNRR